jgi:hypothetical protein
MTIRRLLALLGTTAFVVLAPAAVAGAQSVPDLPVSPCSTATSASDVADSAQATIEAQAGQQLPVSAGDEIDGAAATAGGCTQPDDFDDPYTATNTSTPTTAVDAAGADAATTAAPSGELPLTGTDPAVAVIAGALAALGAAARVLSRRAIGAR